MPFIRGGFVFLMDCFFVLLVLLGVRKKNATRNIKKKNKRRPKLLKKKKNNFSERDKHALALFLCCAFLYRNSKHFYEKKKEWMILEQTNKARFYHDVNASERADGRASLFFLLELFAEKKLFL